MKEHPRTSPSATAEEAPPVSKKQYRSTLDNLEFGPDDGTAADHAGTGLHLPEGVSGRAVYGDIIRLAWPALVEFCLTQLASMVDLMMVGQLGAYALSAVGLATQPKFLMMSMFMSMNVGVTAMIAHSRGSNQPARARMFLRQALVLNIVLSAIGMVLGYFNAESLILFMGSADAETLKAGTEYLAIQMLGLPTIALTSTITAALRGVGNTRAAMIYNLIANLVNVFFNYLLIYGHGGFPMMGVAGASIATVIGQFVAMVLAFIIVMRKHQYARLSFKESFLPDRHALGAIVRIGVPAAFEQLVMRVGLILYTKTVSGLGTVDFAVHQVCMNIHSFSFMGGQSFAVSATTLTGQSLGRRRYDMAQAYSLRTVSVGLVFSIMTATVIYCFAGPLIGLYNSDPYIISAGIGILQLVAFLQPFQSIQFILAGSLRGAGDTRVIAIFVAVTTLALRPFLAHVMVNEWQWGLYGAWIALIVDQLIRSALVVWRYLSGRGKKMQLVR